MKRLLQVIVLLILTTLITKLLIKCWVLKVQRLRDQMAQIQASTVEQIAQLKAEASSREVEAQRKYEELQLQLKAKTAAKEAEASRKYDELQ
ncbi:hypothetical protein Gotur_003028, partial [Gossypium turneri]